MLALVEGARGQLQSLRLEIKVGMWDFDERGWGRIFQGLRSWREVGIARDEDQRFVELVLDHMPVGSTLEIVNLYVTTYKIFDASGTSTDRRLRSLDDTLADRLADAVSQGRAPRLHQLFVQAPPESERTRTAGRRRGNLSTLETPRRNWPFVEWERVRTFMKTYRDLKLEHEVFVNGR